jgi:hypothetical protein
MDAKLSPAGILDAGAEAVLAVAIGLVPFQVSKKTTASGRTHFLQAAGLVDKARQLDRLKS